MNNNEEKLGMILGEPFEAFVNAAPISVMMRAVMENTFNPQRLDEIFDQTAESQYTRLLSFSTVANLMSEVVVHISPSVDTAIQANLAEVEVSRKSVYNKRRWGRTAGFGRLSSEYGRAFCSYHR